MLILISCAKTMSFGTKAKPMTGTQPLFLQEATNIAAAMTQYSVEEISTQLKVNSSISADVHRFYNDFNCENFLSLNAIFAYTGVVFKHINPNDFTLRDMNYAQENLRITSFCYGLLRPLDLIKQYRLEGDVELDIHDGKTMFSFWQEKLTDLFIAEIKKSGGVLCYLASDEMKRLFNWKRVEKEVRIVTPEFKVYKKGKLSTIVVYTKMCRGEMSKYIIKNRITDPEELKHFDWEGFTYSEELSTPKKMMFVSGGTI